MTNKKENNITPTIVNIFLPGVGQMMKGQTGKGIAFLIGYIISVLLMFVIIGLITTPIIYIWALVDAYRN